MTYKLTCPNCGNDNMKLYRNIRGVYDIDIDKNGDFTFGDIYHPKVVYPLDVGQKIGCFNCNSEFDASVQFFNMNKKEVK